MQSSRSESVSPRTQRVQSLSATDTRGKHRIQAELKRLEQEARFLEVCFYSYVFFFFVCLLINCFWDFVNSYDVFFVGLVI